MNNIIINNIFKKKLIYQLYLNFLQKKINRKNENKINKKK